MRPGTRPTTLAAFSMAALVLALLIAPVSPAAASLWVDHESTVVTENGDDDGTLEPGEGLALTENVLSFELMTLTGVGGVLSSSTPGVTVTQASSPYPDLDFVVPAGNLISFAAMLDPAEFECGVRASFGLALTTNQGTAAVSFGLPTGGVGNPIALDATAVPVPLADGGTETAELVSTTTGRVKHATVRIGRLTHTADGDLRLVLVAPDGTAVTLVNGRGGSGDDFVDTVFDDAAATRIRDGVAPFTGTFRPESPLAALDGVQLAGTWQLRVTDRFPGDRGTLEAWGEDLSPAYCSPPSPPPPGFGHRSQRAQGEWPAPTGFATHANSRAHAVR
jgi:subtilisin-like proprotein convertase family protein